MSAYSFIAADKDLKELCIGVEDLGYGIRIEDENHILNIFDDEPSEYTKPFSDLPIIMGIETGSVFSTVEKNLVQYIKDALQENDTVEIWSTWMEETEDIDKKTIHEDELTLEHLRWVLDRDEITNPRGIKIYKWTRGKK